MNYAMFQLKEDTANTVNFFYHNELLIILENLITLLKQTYNDVNHKYTVMTKLKTLQQRNHEFTSFFSEFFNLVDELNWNESVKIAVLQHAIFDEICVQLVTQKMLKILSEFAILYQQINENFWYNQSAWSWKIVSWITSITNLFIITARTLNSHSDVMNIDII